MAVDSHFVVSPISGVCEMSGFPLLTPTMQAGQDSDAGGGGWFRGNVYVACSDCVVVLVLGDKFNDSAPSTGVL